MSSSSGCTLHFMVFSFNRGDFLKNCVESIRYCAPQADITIWDDNSDDHLTLNVLDELSATCKVKQPAQYSANASKLHGGLYGNMQSALEDIPGNPLICTIQDDMQLVRRLADGELSQLQELYNNKQFNGLLHPGFIKRLKEKISYVPDFNGYHIDRLARSAGTYYSDLFLTQLDLMLKAGWRFFESEARNEQQARENFNQMVYMKNPFIAWLPGVPAWRGRKRTWALRVAERKRKCALYPFKIMSDESAKAFCERPHTDIPMAEKHLELSGPSLPKPWFYHPLQGRSILRQINKLELRFTR